MRLIGTEVPVFRLADLVSVYMERLVELSPENKEKVNSTRLKERILLHCPYLKAVKQGRDVLLTYDAAVGDAILMACSDEDSEALQLARVALIIRKELFSHDHKFSGSLSNDSMECTIPNKLLTLVNMILDGPSIKSQTGKEVTSTQAAKTICELTIFNSIRGNCPRKDTVRHNSDREVPVPVYLGLKVHAKTRNRELIDRLHQHGLSISYDRVLKISSSIAQSIITRFENDGVVCPPQLKGGLFTTGQVDNIDHNPSATTAFDSFHGTAHSLCQHPTEGNQGTDPVPIVPDDTVTQKRIPPLPLAYTNILPAPSMPKEVKAPVIKGPIRPERNKFQDDRETEYKWLDKAMSLIEAGDLAVGDFVSWAAYHASMEIQHNTLPTTIALMPLFREESHSFATILHCMKTNQEATQLLNPGQKPVLTMDQPLYALGKQIQWKFPDVYGEDKYVMMLGPLHIEMAGLKMIGDLLDGTGWTNAIAQAEVATKGTADSFIHASHVAKTRRAHQVTASSIYILQRQAFECDKESSTYEVPVSEESFTEWCKEKSKDHPMFRFWSTVLDLELTVLTFVRSIRTADFDMYVETLSQLAPWFFALDHVHYARWISVHIRDMASLAQQCPDVQDHFMHGAFTSNKTGNLYSAIGLDHAHEQLNAQVKGDGGAIGLTEDPGALRRWMVAGPHLAKIIGEYESNVDNSHVDTNSKHHEQSTTQQKAFANDVRSLVAVMAEFGNPFLDRTKDLLTIDSQDIMPQRVVESLENIHSLGESKYLTFIEERLLKNDTPISATIPRNSLPLFRKPKHADPSKDKQKITELKSDCALFSRLYIASQKREGDIKEFFKHENQKYPPSLSSSGKLKQGKKSDLVGCLETKTDSDVMTTPSVEVTVMDGAAVVHFLPLRESKTFAEYAKDVFIPHVLWELSKTQRVDLVWDVYLQDSLKLSARANRGTGTRKRVSKNTKLPGNWKNFLRNDDNKDELFQFLGQECISNDTGDKIIISTLLDSVISSRGDQNTDGLQPCSHEEADTRMLLHVKDAMNCGYKSVMIRTVDTDVVVLAVAHFQDLPNIQQLWIAFGTGKDFRYIPIHEIASALCPQMAKGLLFFHAFTGCDVTSYFNNHGKKSAWKTWLAWPEITESFVTLSEPCTVNIPEEVIVKLERFVVLMYCRTSDEMCVDVARMTLFSKMSRNIENIPPTRAALEQHIMRSSYQSGHVWGQSLELQPAIPNVTDWGWETSTTAGYIPNWTTLPVAEAACMELISCKCAKSCKGNCKCFKANLECTQLCKCAGNCYK